MKEATTTIDAYDDIDSTETITSSKQIFSRAAFAGRIEVTVSELDRIVAPYELPKNDWINCSLNTCTKIHGKGYVIRTKDGRESNCGQDCGRSKFDVDFDTFVTDFQRRKVDRTRQQILRDAQSSAKELLAKVDGLLPEVESAARRVDEILDVINRDPGVQGWFYDAVRRDGRLQVEEEISASTREATGSKERFRAVTVAQFLGTEAIDEKAKARASRSLKMIVRPTLDRLLQLDLASISAKDGDALSLELAEVRRHIQDAEAYLAGALTFCAPPNIASIAKISDVMRNKTGRAARTLKALQRLTTL